MEYRVVGEMPGRVGASYDPWAVGEGIFGQPGAAFWPKEGS